MSVSYCLREKLDPFGTPDRGLNSPKLMIDSTKPKESPRKSLWLVRLSSLHIPSFPLACDSKHLISFTNPSKLGSLIHLIRSFQTPNSPTDWLPMMLSFNCIFFQSRHVQFTSSHFSMRPLTLFHPSNKFPKKFGSYYPLPIEVGE